MGKKAYLILIATAVVCACFLQWQAADLNLEFSLLESSFVNTARLFRRPEFLPDFSVFRNRLSIEKSNWLEVNLEKKEVAIYKKDMPEKIVPILRWGDPMEWGGTAAGLNEVIFKAKSNFSNTALVFMPWAVNFYGKYYLHGEPYDANGQKFISENSGGCVQMTDADAQAVYEESTKGIPVLVIDKSNDTFRYPRKKPAPMPKTAAKSYLVADLDSGFVFAEKNIEEKLPVASLTKLITATTLSENAALNTSLSVKKHMLDAFGSTTGLTPGARFKVAELFYPLLVESSNDAALVLSAYFGIDRTLELMNDKTARIMMPDSRFVDPHGYDPGNVSTAKDLFYLARYVSNNWPLLWRIARGEEVRIFGKNRFLSLKNKNLFFDEPDFIGGKTGYIKASDYNGLFVFRFLTKREVERRIVIIILGAPGLEEGEQNLKQETLAIIDWLKENYFNRP
ncbi:MAG: L,D-transpeptidase family protein [bacterium]|nr:L,D-transpeptidase family protein [bacterium]